MRHFDGPPPIHGLTPREREREYIGRNAGSQGLLARIDGLISIDVQVSIIALVGWNAINSLRFIYTYTYIRSMVSKRV